MKLRFTIMDIMVAVVILGLLFAIGLTLSAPANTIVFCVMMVACTSGFFVAGVSVRGYVQPFALAGTVPLLAGSVYVVKSISRAMFGEVVTEPHHAAYTLGSSCLVLFAGTILVAFVAGLAAVAASAMVKHVRAPGKDSRG